MRSKAQGFKKRKLTKKQSTAIAQLIKSRKTEAFLEVFGRRLAAMAWHNYEQKGRVCLMVLQQNEFTVFVRSFTKDEALKAVEASTELFVKELKDSIDSYDPGLEMVLLFAYRNQQASVGVCKAPGPIQMIYWQQLDMRATPEELTQCLFADHE